MDHPDAVAALGALAHDHRLTIYRWLVEHGPEGLSAGVIAERLGVPPSSLTFHLQHLQRAGLIAQRRAGRQLIYAADFDRMRDLVGFLTENCCAASPAMAACPGAEGLREPRHGGRSKGAIGGPGSGQAWDGPAPDSGSGAPTSGASAAPVRKGRGPA